MHRLRLLMILLGLFTAFVAVGHAEKPKVKVIAIEAAMRAWQERYHTTSPFYAYWYPRSDGTEPGRFPQDCFYGDDLLCPQKAADLVNNLLHEMRYSVVGRFAADESQALVEGADAFINWEGISLYTLPNATVDNYVSVFQEIVRVLRRCNVIVFSVSGYEMVEFKRGDAAIFGVGSPSSCEEAKARAVAECLLNRRTAATELYAPAVSAYMIYDDYFHIYNIFMTTWAGRYSIDLTRYVGGAALYVREYSVPSRYGALSTSPALLIGSTVETASTGMLWKSRTYGWDTLPPTLECPDNAPSQQTAESRYYVARVAARPTFQYHVEDAIVECESCLACQARCVPSQLETRVGSLEAIIALGGGPDGSAGSITLKADVPSSTLATPFSLKKKLLSGARAILDQNNLGPEGLPGIRQIAAAQAFVDVVTLDTYGYELRFYAPGNQGAVNAQGFYEPVGTPFRVLKVENPDRSPTIYNRLSITGTGEGGTDVATFVYNASTNGWELMREKDGQVVVERRSSVIDPMTRRRVEIHRKEDGAGRVALDEQNTYQVFPWNTGSNALRTEELVETISDPSGVALRTAYTFYEDPVADGPNYGHVKYEVEPNGSWQKSEYDSVGRVSRLTTPFLNAAVGASAGVRVRETAWSGSFPHETVVESLVLADGSKVELRRNYRNFNYDKITSIAARAPGAAWDDSSNLVSITRSDNTGQFNARVAADIRPDGTGTLHVYQVNGDGSLTTTTSGGALNTGKSAVVAGTRSISTQSKQGEVIDERVYDIASGLLLSMRVVTETDAFGRATRIDYLDGTHEERAYACCGLEYMVDREGVRTDYGYDAFRRLEHETRAGITTHYTYDDVGRRLTALREGSDGTTVPMESNRYDLTGRLLSTTAPGGRTTTFDESIDAAGQTMRTSTGPDQSTRIETFALDGSLLAIGGTGAAPVKYEYGADADGSFTKVIHVGSDGEETEWVKTYTDMLGQVTKTLYPDGAGGRMFYNAVGQLVRQVDPDGVTTLYSYDSQGAREVVAIDMDGNGVIDFAGTDRVARTRSEVGMREGVVVQRATTMVWELDGQDVPAVASVSETSADGLRSWRTVNDLTVSSSIVYDGAGGRTVTSLDPGGGKMIQVYSTGRLVSVVNQSSGGEPLNSAGYDYDPHGRLRSFTDVGTGVTDYTYYADDQIRTVTTPDPDTQRSGSGYDRQVTTYHYDAAGRPDDITLSDGTHTYTAYWPGGQIKRTWGSRTYPTGYTYDSQGRLKTLTTWQDYAGEAGAAVTTWNYDPQRGWLLNKRFDNNKGPGYIYTAGGRLKTRTWARVVDGRPLTVTYGYTVAGELESTDYSDETPDVVTTYDRRGRMRTTTDAAGVLTRSYEHGNLDDEIYNGTGLLAGLSVARTTDELHRPQSLTATSVDPLTYGYNTAGRLGTITQGARVATFGYKPQVGSHQSTTITVDGNERITSVRATDNAGRTSSMTAGSGATGVLASTGYTYNDANQRVRAVREDSFGWNYGYDVLGQVTAAEKRLADGATPLGGYSFGYDYDDIGNRLTTVTNGRTSTYAPTRLNTYEQRTVPGAVDVTGEAAMDATVTVNFQPATRQNEAFYRAVPVDNTTAPRQLDLMIVGVKTNVGPDGADAVTATSRQVFVAQTPEVFAYDDDGNLTQDGRWDYMWDGENRLVAMETRATVATAIPALKKRLEFAYDASGRRIGKIVKTWTGDAWAIDGDMRFLYDGWNLLAEYAYDGTYNLARSYVWGLDVSGSDQGAGGVGGLLWVATPAAAYAPGYDGNGNVLIWVDMASGAIAGRRDYGAFGEPLQAEGVARELPFGFSTKYLDGEGGLYYYGYRYYNPSTGRWPSRDPLEEDGGVNLYAFVDNVPTAWIDPLGLALYAFDGTNNDGYRDKPKKNETNVFVLFEVYKGNAAYLPGVGTNDGLLNLLGLAFGYGGQAREHDMLERAGEYIRKGDLVADITGFSRGAAQARDFANKLKKEYPCVAIRWMGLFDTVASEGFPNDVNIGYELGIPAGTGSVLHLTAGGERRRKTFALSSINPGPSLSNPNPNYHEEEMADAVHSDVGGFYGNNRGLANQALQRMWRDGRSHGVPFGPLPVRYTNVTPNGPNDSRWFNDKAVEFLTGKKRIRKIYYHP